MVEVPKKNIEELTIEEASRWVSTLFNKKVSKHNISYLIQYGLINKISKDGTIFVKKEELGNYYEKNLDREKRWKDKLGKDLNWKLSFENLREYETTKHVHRLHPYKGKFIPQLVEYFLNDKTDNFKRETFFEKEDIILDPFSGSGTTLIQANEMGLNGIGIDISYFNTFIAKNKLLNVDISKLRIACTRISNNLRTKFAKTRFIAFDQELIKKIQEINLKYFPSPSFKIKVRQKIVDERNYAREKEKALLEEYFFLVEKYDIHLKNSVRNTFLNKWYIPHILDQAHYTLRQIEKEESPLKNVLKLILSRTMRSCRATTHADLTTLIEPQLAPYYCKKHGKMCKPLFSLENWWNRYCKDTIKRYQDFRMLRTKTHQSCLTGNAKNIDLVQVLQKENPAFTKLILRKKIQGIFSSPPYVGLIDYHEQHAYAYELFGFPRRDKAEIGSLAKGQKETARKMYIEEIARVLIHSKKLLTKNYNVFLVANDKYNLYPIIAKEANMQIINQFKRPVLNRTEKNRNNAYCEIIFHLRERE